MSIYRIRGHHILCLPGFRGYGYSEAFTASLSCIRRNVADPTQKIMLLVGSDDICLCCPHLTEGGCSMVDASEERVKDMDRMVLAACGLCEGEIIRAGDLFSKAALFISHEAQAGICGGCRWWSLGYCLDGFERLRREGEIGIGWRKD